ncbi:hypothetical protein AGMMS49921_13740 [Endomicrobiia bacterium]|nr:hypothetical protein AGMMS49921_13740 [Endomicrobiia bacterium]
MKDEEDKKRQECDEVFKKLERGKLITQPSLLEEVAQNAKNDREAFNNNLPDGIKELEEKLAEKDAEIARIRELREAEHIKQKMAVAAKEQLMSQKATSPGKGRIRDGAGYESAI